MWQLLIAGERMRGDVRTTDLLQNVALSSCERLVSRKLSSLREARTTGSVACSTRRNPRARIRADRPALYQRRIDGTPRFAPRSVARHGGGTSIGAGVRVQCPGGR
jgi:hypothetical protein